MPKHLMHTSETAATPSWIKHFEDQASTGVASRSLLNRRVIILQKSRASDKSTSKLTDPSLPSIISPVQQTVEQAEEDIRREGTQTEKVDFARVLTTNNNSQKRTHSALTKVLGGDRSRKKSKVKHGQRTFDIFS